MLISKLIFMVIATASAFAFDSIDYTKTMASDHLKSGRPEKALEVINDGLEEDSSNAELLELKRTALTALSKKKKVLSEIAKKRNLEKDAQKQQQVTERQLAQKKLEEEELKQRPEYLRKALCDCEAQRRKAESKIRDEEAIASHAGVVNKATLHEAGQTIVNLDKAIAHIRFRMTSDKVEDLGCSGRMPTSEWSTPCSDYWFKYSAEIKK